MRVDSENPDQPGPIDLSVHTGSDGMIRLVAWQDASSDPGLGVRLRSGIHSIDCRLSSWDADILARQLHRAALGAREILAGQ